MPPPRTVLGERHNCQTDRQMWGCVTHENKPSIKEAAANSKQSSLHPPHRTPSQVQEVILRVTGAVQVEGG